MIVTVLAAIYARYGQVDALQRILAGVSCAAVGLFLAVIARMTLPLLKRRDPVVLTILVAVFIATGILRVPLPIVLLVAVPTSIALTWWIHKRAAA
jgi:chromate transporter